MLRAREGRRSVRGRQSLPGRAARQSGEVDLHLAVDDEAELRLEPERLAVGLEQAQAGFGASGSDCVRHIQGRLGLARLLAGRLSRASPRLRCLLDIG